MVDYPRCRRTSWADADRWADTLAGRIREADRLPQVIVALTRGGWVPARLLADRLGIRRLVSIRAQHLGVTATPSGKAELTEGLSGPVQDLEVLVVDDITDTGQSLDLATAHVRAAGARRVESATCLHITHSTFVPTYFAEEIPREGWVWIVFPWNYWEDLATLGRRAVDESRNLTGAVELLRERCGLNVTEADLRFALDSVAPQGKP
jgi:uncharacterized protein